jgi:hypothetical protein
LRSATQTTVFGLRVKLDPKILIGGIILFAGFLYWYNSRSEDEGSNSAANPAPPAPVIAMPKSHIAAVRRNSPATSDRGALRLRPIDATRGNVDPTLRLDLLARLQSEDDVPAGRSLFEAGPTPAQIAAAAKPINAPVIVPKNIGPPIPVAPQGPPPVNIPLKFYGYVEPTAKGEAKRGFFMDGDNVLVATEGQVLKQKYKVLELSAKSARLEDVQLRQDQTLAVVPQAADQ